MVEEYINLGKALASKYEEIKKGKINRQISLEEHFSPLLTPLHNIDKQLNQKLHFEKQEETFDKIEAVGDIAYKYLHNYSPTNKGVGIQVKNNHLYVDDQPIWVINNNLVFQDGKVIRGSEGLWRLLTQSDATQYNKTDLKKYREILAKGRPKLPQIEEEEEGRVTRGKKKIGKGLQKILTNAPVEYVYWNDRSELLKRLYILVGEINAGNTNPQLFNELVNIQEELAEEAEKNGLPRRKNSKNSRNVPSARSKRKK